MGVCNCWRLFLACLRACVVAWRGVWMEVCLVLPAVRPRACMFWCVSRVRGSAAAHGRLRVCVYVCALLLMRVCVLLPFLHAHTLSRARVRGRELMHTLLCLVV